MNGDDIKKWLDYVYYKVGKQTTNFRLCHAYRTNGKIVFSKWKRYLDAQSNLNFISKCNQRTLLNNEIVLDCDNGIWFEVIIKKLKENQVKFKAYSTESKRANHIHIFEKKMFFLSKNKREGYREQIIGNYKCDPALKSDNHMVPIEGVIHWKTGELKRVVCEN